MNLIAYSYSFTLYENIVLIKYFVVLFVWIAWGYLFISYFPNLLHDLIDI